MTERLIIEQAPAAFADLSQKHNAVVALIKAIVGKNGVKVTVSDTNIIIEGSGQATGLVGYTERAYSVCDGVGGVATVTFLTKT